MRKGLLAIALMLVMVLIIPLGCKAPTEAPPPSPTPAAEFEVTSLHVMPPEVAAGETVSVTAEIRNTGASEGTYTAVLTVDGAKGQRKDVVVAAGASETVTFQLAEDTPGTYQIGIGELSSTLVVKKKPVAKEVELKYDDGTAETCASAGPKGGYLVDFSPQATPFTIKKVRIRGVLVGSGWEGKEFKVQIWDKDQKVLHSASYPFTQFPAAITVEQWAKAISWIEIEVPDIEVKDDFYVHVYTDSHRGWGIAIGVDRSVINQHSNGTTDYEIWAVWPRYSGWLANKENVNWMIRVTGTILGQ